MGLHSHWRIQDLSYGGGRMASADQGQSARAPDQRVVLSEAVHFSSHIPNGE